MTDKQAQTTKIEKAYILYYVILVIALIVVVRILVIQYRDGDELRAKASKRSIIESIIRADRGNIYSRNGELIATSLPKFDIFVDFSKKNVDDKVFNPNVDSLAIYLSRHFPEKTYLEFLTLLKKYRKEQHTYGLVLRNIDYNQLQLVRAFPMFNKGRYAGGIIVEKKERRIHPFGWLAQRTIGFSRQGFKVGLEGAYDKQLSGKDGKRLKQRLPNSRFVPLDDNFIVKPVQGVDIVTTLDMIVQDVAESALYYHLKKHNAQWGCAVLMEVETGEIRAIANLERDSAGRYWEKYNHAIGTRYEPGSSFKLFSMLAMLEDGLLDLNRMINTGRGAIKVGKNEVFDSRPMGVISAREVFERSSNVGTIMLVREFYGKNPSKFIDRLHNMKMHLPMGIDILGERPAKIPRPRTPKWSRSSSLESVSYGYGLSITPLQLLSYYNAVVNKGKLMRPKFVKEFRISGKTVKTFEPVVIDNKICSPKTAKILMDLMEGVVEKGTASHLKNAVCKIAGKTATSKIWDVETQSYSNRDYIATFVGYFPADNPKYSCIVVVSKPSMGLYYGGNVSAPVFKDIAEIVFATEPNIHDPVERQKFKGIRTLPKVGKIHTNSLKNFIALMPEQVKSIKIPDKEWIKLTNDPIPSFVSIDIQNGIMPDLTEMNLRDASALLQFLGCKVNAIGKGKVFRQSITPGSKIKKGQTVALTLK